MELLSNLALGFGVAFTFQNLLYALGGCILGTLIGVLPGLGPVATIAMLLPSIYSLDATPALIMLAGIYYGAQYGGSTTAILINVPGESSSVVTAIDGYQMARQGRAGAALAAAGLGSFFAGCVGTIVIAAFAPPLTELAFKFGPAEYFSLMVLGLIGAVVLASGSVPRTIPGFEVDGRRVVTSDELLSLTELPATAAVIGGGAIGCEFASMMSDLGTKVTILEALPKILPGCDEDITSLVLRSFKKRKIDVRTGVAVTGHAPHDGGTVVSFGEGETVDVELVVVSVGRRPYTDGLLREGTQVEVGERGFITVDEHGRTAEPGVYAVGDAIPTPALAHVAFAEGIQVIQDLLGEEPLPVDYGNVPWCIYCHPEVAFVGHSEQSAKDAGLDVVVSKHRYIGNGRALILGEAEGMVKIIAEQAPDGGAGRLVGVHMVGPWVTEQLGQAYLSVNWEATADEVARFVQPHPTLSELFGESVMALTGRGLHG